MTCFAKYFDKRILNLKKTSNSNSHQRCFVKKVFLKTSQISQENVCVGDFLIQLQAFNREGLQLYYKETPTRVFSSEICKILKNIYFEEHLRTTASVYKMTACLSLLVKLSISILTQSLSVRKLLGKQNELAALKSLLC